MHWYYSINDGAYESEGGQTLKKFLEAAAKNYIESHERGDYLTINELAITFSDDSYQLPVKEAASFVDAINADYAADDCEDVRYGTYKQQVQSYYNSTRF